MNMIKKKKVVGHSPKLIQNVFVLLLLSLFAILSTFLVTVGAQQYRNTVDSAEVNNNTRIMTAVVRSAIWAEDGGEVRIEDLDYKDENNQDQTLTALSIIHDYDGETWIKRLYAYEGYLLESFTLYMDDETGEVADFIPDHGESMCELLKFEPSFEDPKEYEKEEDALVLTVQLETKDHQPATVRMVMRSGGGKE